MSGGYYDKFLWCKTDAEDLFAAYPDSDLEEMANDLAKTGYADDVASETLQLMLMLRVIRVQVNTRLKRLTPIWHSLDYWKSCDTSETTFKNDLAQWRKKHGVEE